ncbi:HAMP domain-containing sensor histidine kinase [Desulfosporosinus sp. PR]|uniref:sensor histidine kinase n=1 Tax=Candidatus Desulfosporosinus nitrosoreducens TaxID=3401928 RepID=UPI0027F56A04|nr:HAMP domain-containing sensor histidine kinase [Desulfosporosinus sp. PR]MDQ7097082.1 HAMP domain-containing sensor histidine kinase [Desulfosporosinus sp. PR]
MSCAPKTKLIGKLRFPQIKWGLAWKITLWYILLLLLTVLILSTITYWGNSQDLHKEKQQVLESTVTRVLGSLDDQMEGQAVNIHDPEVLNDDVPKGVTIQLTSLQGNVLQKKGNVNVLLPIEQQTGPEIRNFNGKDVYYMARPIMFGGKQIGTLQGAADLEDIELAQTVLLRQLLWLGGSASLLASIGGLILSRKVLAPLEELNREISLLTANDLNRRLSLRGNKDELDLIGQNFNHMLQRLETSFQQQKQFVADASHELRTPLMVIRGHADILQRWGAEDPAVVRDSATAMVEETKMMTKLVENLLTLAREELHLTLVSLNLSELIIESARGLPFLCSFVVKYDLLPDIELKGDALYLKQLIRIILENAGKYVPSGGIIRIFLQKAEDKVRIIIEDNGPGFPPDALELIFDRFYRVDEARSRKIPGHGLGLSIAKRIVHAHGGGIWAENLEPHGARFCIELPCNNVIEV